MLNRTEKNAKIIFPVTALEQGAFLKVDGWAFLHQASPEQTLKISSHGQLLYEWSLSLNSSSASRSFFLSAELMKNGFIELDFSLVRPLTIPKEHGISSDSRKLGFFFKSMEVIPAKFPFEKKFESDYYQRIAGFYPPEGTGIWSISQMAALELKPIVNGKVRFLFKISTVPTVKVVKVFYKGNLITVWNIKGDQEEIHEVDLNIPVGENSITLSFLPEDPMIPGKVYKNYNDFRNLGVRLLTVEYK